MVTIPAIHNTQRLLGLPTTKYILKETHSNLKATYRHRAIQIITKKITSKFQERKPATDDKMDAPATADNMDAPATADSMGAPATDDKMDAPATADNMDAPATDDHMGGPATDHKMGAPATDDKTGAPATDDNMGVPAAADNMSAPPFNPGFPLCRREMKKWAESLGISRRSLERTMGVRRSK